VSGRFSSREIVDCEHSSSSDGRRSQRQLEHRIAAQQIRRRCRLLTGRDHQHAEADDLGQAVQTPAAARGGP